MGGRGSDSELLGLEKKYVIKSMKGLLLHSLTLTPCIASFLNFNLGDRKIKFMIHIIWRRIGID